MKAKDYRGLSKEELAGKLEDFRKQLMELEFKRRTGGEKPHLFKQTKKNIARILTILREKEVKQS
jgi:large subunit ribosomal protein L29